MKRGNVKYLAVIAVLILIAAIFAFSPVAGGQGKAGSNASLKITPTSGYPRDKMTVTGSGFAPGEEIKILLPVEGVTLQLAAKGTGGIVKADERGQFEMKRVFPRGVDAGVYELIAAGNKGGRASCQIEIKTKKK